MIKAQEILLEFCSNFPFMLKIHYIWLSVGISLLLGDCFSQNSSPTLLPTCQYFARTQPLHHGFSAAQDNYDWFKESKEKKQARMVFFFPM